MATAPYLEGARARLYGRPLSHNPYKDTLSAEGWETGWRDEDGRLRREEDDE